ncbi:MAG: MOSC domain-containing protein [Gaiellales bacterium]
MPGRVEAIHISAVLSGRVQPVAAVRAIAGRGLEGDRYPVGDEAAPGEALTLIEAEALEALAAENGIVLAPGESRRQLTTRGIGLNDLVGREFTVGPVRCRGVELCEPCAHLASLTQPGVLRGLVRRGGLRADILAGGEIAVGDEVLEHRPA